MYRADFLRGDGRDDEASEVELSDMTCDASARMMMESGAIHTCNVLLRFRRFDFVFLVTCRRTCDLVCCTAPDDPAPEMQTFGLHPSMVPSPPGMAFSLFVHSSNDSTLQPLIRRML